MSDLSKQQLVEAFEYLDELRESGRTNMWGAPGYLANEVPGWTTSDAREATKLWMHTFDSENEVDIRVEEAFKERES